MRCPHCDGELDHRWVRREWQREQYRRTGRYKKVNREAVTIAKTEAQLLAALEFPQAFYAEGPGLTDGSGWL